MSIRVFDAKNQVGDHEYEITMNQQGVSWNIRKVEVQSVPTESTTPYRDSGKITKTSVLIEARYIPWKSISSIGYVNGNDAGASIAFYLKNISEPTMLPFRMRAKFAVEAVQCAITNIDLA